MALVSVSVPMLDLTSFSVNAALARRHTGEGFENRDSLVPRSNEARQWILSDPTLQKWLQISSDLHWVSLYGETGYGKTMVTAYIVEWLKNMFRFPKLA